MFFNLILASLNNNIVGKKLKVFSKAFNLILEKKSDAKKS